MGDRARTLNYHTGGHFALLNNEQLFNILGILTEISLAPVFTA
jgi:hypothetical protein